MKRRQFLKIVAAATAAIPAQAIAKPLFDIGFFNNKKAAAPIREASNKLGDAWKNTIRFDYIPASVIEWTDEISLAEIR